MRSVLFYGLETWPIQVEDERVLEVFDNDSISHILHVRRGDCVPTVELRRRPCQNSSSKEGPTDLNMLRDVLNDLILFTLPHTWSKRKFGELKT